MKKALIITGGYINFDKLTVKSNEYSIIIAADSGYVSAEKLGIKPSIIIGDFDSAPLPQNDIETITFPSEKDDTDTMLACNLAIERGCTHISIIGGTGGRADHYLSNIFSLEVFKEQGIDVSITDGENAIKVLKNETVKILNKNCYFSLIPIGKCYATLQGCKYPLNDQLLPTINPSFAISNEVTSPFATVSIKGKAILCECQK